MLVTALEANEEVPHWEIVTEHLLYKETKIKQKEVNSNEMKAMTTHHISQRWREPQSKFSVGNMDT